MTNDSHVHNLSYSLRMEGEAVKESIVPGHHIQDLKKM